MTNSGIGERRGKKTFETPLRDHPDLSTMTDDDGSHLPELAHMLPGTPERPLRLLMTQLMLDVADIESHPVIRRRN